MVGTNLGLGFAKYGAAGLIAGYIAGQVIATMVLSWKTLRNYTDLTRDISRQLIVENARKYRNFLRINTPHAFIGSLQDHGIVYVIMAFFNKAVLGSYSFAFRLVTAPASLIGSSIYQVFYQKASMALQEGQDIQAMVLRIYRNLFVIGLPIFAMLFFFGPPIFAFVFGEEWVMAGEIGTGLVGAVGQCVQLGQFLENRRHLVEWHLVRAVGQCLRWISMRLHENAVATSRHRSSRQDGCQPAVAAGAVAFPPRALHGVGGVEHHPVSVLTHPVEGSHVCDERIITETRPSFSKKEIPAS